MSKGIAFAQVNDRVSQAGEYLDLPKGLVQAISSCEREVVISIPLHHSDDIEVLTGYRVQHSSARGPRKLTRKISGVSPKCPAGFTKK